VLPNWIGIRGTFFAGGAMIAVAALGGIENEAPFSA